MLYVTSGLPGTGKSTLARQLAQHLNAIYLRVDTVEAALLNHGLKATVEGYAVTYAVALDNLHLGSAVVVDVVNPLAVTRDAWADVAHAAGARLVNIEVVCPDETEHRRRVQARRDDRGNQVGEWSPPTWASVQASAREFEPWTGERVVVDTAGRTSAQAFAALLAALDTAPDTSEDRERMDMPAPLLLVVTGLPAAGKSFLGSRLARALRWPFVTKDEYKTILHAGLPGLEYAQSGPLSFELMYHVAGVTLAAGADTVLETHFYRGLSEPKLAALAAAHGARLAQLYCEAPLDVLRDRHAARVASGARPHIDRPMDYATLPDFCCKAPLELNAPLMRVDTTGPDPLPDVLAWVASLR